jgi:hypothetical protein
MPSKSQNTERVLNILRELPLSKINEVIDFAEYLKVRSQKTTQRKPARTGVPLYHMGAINQEAFDRASLYGEHLESGIA